MRYFIVKTFIFFILFFSVSFSATAKDPQCCLSAVCTANVGWVDHTDFWCGSDCRESAKGFIFKNCPADGNSCNFFGCNCGTAPCNGPCDGVYRCSRTSCICVPGAEETQKMTVEQVWNHFYSLDKDASKSITFEEFSTFLNGILDSERIKKEFDTLDKNSNNIIDPVEFDVSLGEEKTE